jgi:hypothetical protein
MNGILGVQKSGHKKRVIGAFLTLGCSGWFGFRTDGSSFVPGQKTGSSQRYCHVNGVIVSFVPYVFVFLPSVIFLLWFIKKHESK